jgi:hypothetical protein
MDQTMSVCLLVVLHQLCLDLVGSQVCNLSWSKNVNEIVSTHGYSQNQIIVWKHSTMTKLATLTGHTLRVLYLAVSPDGQTIVTGAGQPLSPPVFNFSPVLMTADYAHTYVSCSRDKEMPSLASRMMCIKGRSCNDLSSCWCSLFKQFI